MDYPLVFVHGAGDSARAWTQQVGHFGSRAYALDLPGHGARPDNLPEQVSVTDYAQAAWRIVLDELHLERPIIVGHSLGGLIALQMGLDFGAHLGGLILIGTGARMRVAPALLESARTNPQQAQQTLRQAPRAELEQEAFSPLSPLSPQEQGGRTQLALLYRDLLACNGFDVMARLEQLSGLPVLILCGAEERSAPVKYSVYLHEHIGGSTLQVIPGAGHYVQREKPEEVNQAIGAWLARN
ncbi:MAG TPA: alpha/beta hydrolase [Ktedonobacteraceae bacterium]